MILAVTVSSIGSAFPVANAPRPEVKYINCLEQLAFDSGLHFHLGNITKDKAV